MSEVESNILSIIAKNSDPTNRIMQCVRCGYIWERKVNIMPIRCSFCNSSGWNKERIRNINHKANRYPINNVSLRLRCYKRNNKKLVNPIQRTEFQIISNKDEIFKVFDNLCYKSKNIYNDANYIIRQELFNSRRWIRYNELNRLMKKRDSYKQLPSRTSQQILRNVDIVWKLYFTNMEVWGKTPEKFNSKPKIPNYKSSNGRYMIIFEYVNRRPFLKGLIGFPKNITNLMVKTNVKNNVNQVRIIPLGKCYRLEVIYEKEKVEKKPFNYRIASIDLGLDNFVTMTNNIGLRPVVINGKIIKSMNQCFNKIFAEKRSILKLCNDKDWSNELSRLIAKHSCKVSDFTHKTSRMVVNYCLLNNINTLVIGYNKRSKKCINIGKINNQNYYYIPYSVLINQLRYKCEDVGIDFIVTEESYTSKASFIDNDELPKEYIKGLKPIFSGKRIKRGLYCSKDGTLINADVNGSYNIGRKVFPNEFIFKGIEGVELHPVRLNCLTKMCNHNLVGTTFI